MQTTLNTTESLRKRTSILVHFSAEIAALAVVISAIGVWYSLAYPTALILQQPVVDAAIDSTNSLQLRWTAPGDDGLTGQAIAYDIRSSKLSISESSWSDATPLVSPPTPKAAGSSESVTVIGLVPATTYYFALKTTDEAGNQSAISNIATATTACAEAWSCLSWSACVNGSESRVCSDLNNCGTTVSRPAELRSCTPSCLEDWGCSDWSACTDGLQRRTCTDRNSCGSTENKPDESQVCGAGGAEAVLQDVFVVAAPSAGGGPQVRIFSSAGKLQAQFFAYDKKFTGGINLAAGDLGSDGVDEIVTAPGPGREPMVRIFTKGGELVNQFLAFDQRFRGGVRVAIGDVDGKLGKEIIAAAASRGGPEIRIFGYRNGKYSQVIRPFLAYDRRLRGEWEVAAADINGDNTSEIITVPGENTSSAIVKYFGYNGKQMVVKTSGVQVFPRSFHGGVNLAAADVDGNGRDEVLAVPEGRGGPQVRILGVRANKSFGVLGNGSYLFHPNFHGGVSIAGGDVDKNGKDDIIAAVHSGDQPLVRILRADGKKLFEEFLAFPKELTTGINVAAGHFTAP